MVRVENDNSYNAHFTTKGDNGAIENGLKTGLIDDGFNIGAISSTFTLIEITIETTADSNADSMEVRGSSGSAMFDFGSINDGTITMDLSVGVSGVWFTINFSF